MARAGRKERTERRLACPPSEQPGYEVLLPVAHPRGGEIRSRDDGRHSPRPPPGQTERRPYQPRLERGCGDGLAVRRRRDFRGLLVCPGWQRVVDAYARAIPAHD